MFKRHRSSPTVPPHPAVHERPPVSLYALIHTSPHFPFHTRTFSRSPTRNTPLCFSNRRPRGYIYFLKRSCERSYMRLNYLQQKPLAAYVSTRMEIERFNAGSCRPALQSPAVLVRSWSSIHRGRRGRINQQPV